MSQVKIDAEEQNLWYLFANLSKCIVFAIEPKSAFMSQNMTAKDAFKCIALLAETQSHNGMVKAVALSFNKIDALRSTLAAAATRWRLWTDRRR